MLDPYERWIQFHSLVIKTAPEHAPEFKLEDVTAKLQQAVDKKEAIKLMNKDTASIRIAKMVQAADGSHIRFLFQYANQNVTDPVFMHMKRFNLRPVHKLSGEGVAVSGHVVLGCTKSPKDGSYPLLVEEVPGLGRSNVQPFLRALLKQVSEGHFEFEDEENNNRKKKYRPVAELLDDPSVEFKDDLSTGAVDSIELVARTQAGKGDFDEPGFFQEDVRTVKVHVLKKKGILGQLDALKKKAKMKGFSDFKIRYKKPQGKSRTVVMGTDINDVASAAVRRTELVKSDVELPQCSDDINSAFADKIAKLL